MQVLQDKKIILGVTGGIAAYKSAYLLRELKDLGLLVRVVMTKAAFQFISPLTLQALSGYPVRSELFAPDEEHAMGHIELARWADEILIAPASADFIAKLAHGLADDLLSTLCLAAEVPILLCPAMNQAMWHHPATQSNMNLLRSRGLVIIGPDIGSQACGEIGLGRLSDFRTIISALSFYPLKGLLTGQAVLITAGPTHEAIDPIRYIGNRSSAKMGYALAEAALMAGARVVLIAGPNQLPDLLGVKMIHVETALEMHAAVFAELSEGMIFIAAAAVADYRLQQPALQKLKKQDHEVLSLSLVQNPDILAEVVVSKKAAFVVGFAAETDHVEAYALEKWARKKTDMMVVNQVGSGKGFLVDDNQVTVYTAKDRLVWPLMHKTNLAKALIMLIASHVGG